MNPQFPLYIVSKGRWESRLTSKALERMNVPYHIIVEEQEYENYAAVIDKNKILILDKSYQDSYDVYDKYEGINCVGAGAARNFAWDHSIKNGYKWHWVMDDNIRGFGRLNKNLKIYVSDGTIFKAMEDFCLRYKNIAMAGPNYDYFAPRRSKQPPFIHNTRIYSCNLIRNDVPFRWRGRYNEDTDLSLRMLKKGYCTILFNAFLQYKTTTMIMKGGNTDELYAADGRKKMAKSLADQHPDVVKVTWRFNKWHHIVDYLGFKCNKPIKIDGIKINKKIDNYGMSLKKVK